MNITPDEVLRQVEAIEEKCVLKTKWGHYCIDREQLEGLQLELLVSVMEAIRDGRCDKPESCCYLALRVLDI